MRFQLAIACFVGALWLAPATRAQQQVQTHRVQENETLWSIAQRYDLSVEKLRRLNDLEGNLIKVGQTLTVRRPTDAPPSGDDSAPPPPGQDDTPAAPLSDREYVVQRGETLFSIADRYGISADTLWRLNDRPTAPLDSGRVLQLPGGIQGTHRVSNGESLSLIARRYDVSLAALRRANPDVQGNTIYTGQTLRLPASAESASAQADRDTLSGPVQPYPDAFAGRLTASGEPYDPNAFTVSHGELPLGTVVLLTNPATNRRTFAVVNDRGPLNQDYLLEASDAVLRQLRLDPRSEQSVRLRVVD
jgi:LysM repeat protein